LFRRHTNTRESSLTSASLLVALVRFGLTLSLLINPVLLEAQLVGTAENRVKANFLAKVPGFIEWPEEALPSGPAPFVICIIGDLSLGLPLSESVRGVTLHEKRAEIRSVHTEQELHSCHILFVSRFERKRYDRVLGSVRGLNVLTIGETPEFLDAGGIVSFSMQQETLQFDVNLDEANKAHLKISSRLLALARHVFNRMEAAKS
jgi:YfiR/HmsC-like